MEEMNERIEGIVEQGKSLGCSLLDFGSALRENYPDLRDFCSTMDNFFEKHANKVFLLTCVISCFTSFWAWIAGVAAGIALGQKQGQILNRPTSVGYASCGILLAYFILKPLAYGFSAGCLLGHHLYHVRTSIVNFGTDLA